MSAVEQELKGAGRVLIRPSGTEPVLRVMVEAAEPEIAEAMAQRLASRVGVVAAH
jgi:phosphoglucosamine mutase